MKQEKKEFNNCAEADKNIVGEKVVYFFHRNLLLLFVEMIFVHFYLLILNGRRLQK